MGYDGIISFRPGTRAEWLNYDQVLARGEGAIETDTGIIRVGDGATKYSLLAEYKRSKRPVEYDISSSDVEIVLEDLHGGPQDFACSWSGGDGTTKIRFKLPDGTYSEYEGEGTGKIRFEATEVSGSNKWKVVDYEDKGSNENGYWKKEGRKLTCSKVHSIAVLADTNFTDSGTLYWSKEFSTIESYQAGGVSNYGNAVGTAAMVGGTVTTASYRVRVINVFASANAEGDCKADVIGIGEW